MLARGRVLVVEDEDIISMLTEDMLESLGYTVSATAADLETGLRLASGEEFDVALLDVNLQGQLSYPIADILAQRNIPYIFVSGYSATGLEARFAGASSLQKPFTSAALSTVLEMVFQGAARRAAEPSSGEVE